MNDKGKFRASAILSVILVISLLSYNIFKEHFMTGIGGYLKRKIYFEKVISKKGLSLHKGKYWRKLEE